MAMSTASRWVLRVFIMALNVAFLGFAGWYIFTKESRLFPALLMWLGFSIYWSIAGRNSAPTKSSESKKSAIFHQLLINGSLILLFWPVPWLNGWFEPERMFSLVVVGVAIQASCIALAIWARRHLASNWSAGVRIAENHQLVRTGPYHLLRHPIYTAMLGMYLGTTLASGQYHALVALVILIFAYIRKTRMEEEILQKTFGTEYETYHRDTWALVPLVY
jgi:protein-S-isoprenylcysteine O-methyltransferase Ste14